MTVRKKGAGSPDHNTERPEMRLPSSMVLVLKARDAIDFLIDRDGFWEGPKADFAKEMGWLKRNGYPDRHLVEEVCNLTRDQERKPKYVRDQLAGFVVAYSPSQGGMTLIDPESGEMPLQHYVHILVGDMQRQRQHMTENRRRLPTWKTAGKVAANGNDQELARLCWQAENEIDKSGFVDESTISDMFKVFRSRGLDTPTPRPDRDVIVVPEASASEPGYLA
jgi:hypothetical protein